MYNMYNNNSTIASNMKHPDVNPVHKRDYCYEMNYSLLLAVSKVFERLMSNNTHSNIDKYLYTILKV